MPRRRDQGPAVLPVKTAPSLRLQDPHVGAYVALGEVESQTAALALARSRWEDEFTAWRTDFEAGWGADFETAGTFTPSLHEIVPTELHEWIEWSRHAQIGNGPTMRAD